MQITSMETWVFCAIAARFLIDGLEEYFIAPSAWYYIKSLGGTKLFLGFVLSACPAGALLTVSIAGRLADRFGHIKCIIIFCYVLKVAASLIYSIPVSAYFPLVGRIISGLAYGSCGVFYGQIIFYTPEQYRAKVFIMMDGMFTLGSILGPAISVFATFDIDILGWKINAGNSPGIVLALIWSVLLVNALWLPNEFGEKTTVVGDLLAARDSSDQSYQGNWSRIYLLFYLIFLGSVFSTSVTFYVPLLAQDHFHLPFLHVKLLFLISSMFCLLLFFSFYLAAEYFAETHLLIFSMLMQAVSISLLTYFAFHWENMTGIYGGYILIAYICFGMPYFSLGFGCSLLSKVTEPRDAAFYQGTSYAALYLGYIVSRLISSFIFTKTALLLFCMALFLSWFLGSVWFVLEYRSLTRLWVPNKNFKY